MTTLFVGLANVQLFLSGVAVVLMMANITVDVLGSKLFSTGVPATLEMVSYYYMIAVVFLPLAAIELKREYLIVDLFMDLAPAGLRRCSELLRVAATVTAYGFLTWLTLTSALKSYRTGELVLSAEVIHIWPARFILPLAFAVATLVAAGEIAAILGRVRTVGRPVAEHGR